MSSHSSGEQFRGNYEKADSYLRQALARASDKKEAAKYTFNRGVGAEGNLDYRGARDTYRHAIRLDPTNSGYHERLRSLLAVPGVRVSADMRHPVGSSEADADYRLGLGLTWRLWDFSEKFGIGPQGQFDVNVGGNKATVGGTAGLALIYQEPYGATPTAFVARMGAGGHGIHAATSSDAVDAPVRNGPVFNYSLDFLRPISHQWWVGLALTMEHEMENPGRYAFGPGILLTGMPW
ncbi:MAG: tetratricopeptide repeat protein [Deltaproteobacteria bacterium]|nr:tetratricopeptide repeat protein [Deltaproteobacteria bacterium]